MKKRIRIQRKATGFLMIAGMVAAMSTSAMAYPLHDGVQGTSEHRTTESATSYTDGFAGASQHRTETTAAVSADGFQGASQQIAQSTSCSLHPRLRNVESELCLRGSVEVPSVEEVQFREVEAPQPVPSDGFNVQWIAILGGAIALLAIAAMSVKIYPGHTGGRDWL
jgi:hypothetical protein